MKAVLVSSSDAFGRSLQHLLPAWLEFTPVDSIEKLLGGFSAIDCACVFLHAERITPRLITSLNKAGQRRFQTLFVVADILDRDWEEQAYHAGAAWVFEAPLRPMIFRRQVERFLPPPSGRPRFPRTRFNCSRPRPRHRRPRRRARKSWRRCATSGSCSGTRPRRRRSSSSTSCSCGRSSR